MGQEVEDLFSRVPSEPAAVEDISNRVDWAMLPVIEHYNKCFNVLVEVATSFNYS